MHLKEFTVQDFEKMVQKENLHIKKNLEDLPLSPKDFLETWRLQVWNVRFIFKQANAFSKTKAFKGYKFTDLVVKQVFFWYVSNSMLHESCDRFDFASTYNSCFF